MTVLEMLRPAAGPGGGGGGWQMTHVIAFGIAAVLAVVLVAWIAVQVRARLR